MVGSTHPTGLTDVPGPGRLAGQTCLIVGGTSGIGLASAARFLQEGAGVVVAGLPDGSGERAREQLRPLGEVSFLAVDVCDRAAVDSLVAEAVARLGGRLDILFHAAGMSGRSLGDGPLDECRDEGWNAVLEINARGVFFTNRAAVRLMLGQSLDGAGLRGTILNLGTALVASPSPWHFGTLAYAASKGAVQAMTLAAAARYAPKRIRFNLLVPGLIDTPMAARAVGDPAIRRYLETKQPLAGGPGTVLDVAAAALSLCEPAARFVTGASLTIDGGWCVSEGQHGGKPTS